MKNERDIRVLCKRCRDNYEITGAYYINRYYKKKLTAKEICHICQTNYGLDFELNPKIRRGANEYKCYA